jgi:uncharacterized protein YndB with AHSA1/START domain
MNTPTVTYDIYIATTPERLWAALTTSEFTRDYWSEELQSEWKVGSPIKAFELSGNPVWQGDVLHFEPPRLLSYTFEPIGIGEPPSRIRFDLAPVDAAHASPGQVVHLRLTHDGFAADNDFVAGTRQAWPKVLSSLKSLLETGHSLGFVWQD